MALCVKASIEPLFGGRLLAEWIREGGPPERRVPAHQLRLWWHAHWFEHNWRTQLHLLDKSRLPEEAVFIVGLWRSGTTAVHELLAAVTGWTTPNTWQCFNPSTCFLAPAPALETFVERPMDKGRIATRSPQEDEFALLLLGEPSIYRGFIDPRRLHACAEAVWSAGDVRLDRWQEFLRGIMLEATDGRLLLKSPAHTFRLPLLQSLFPRARFIWVARHVGEVLASNLKMWRAMTNRYALWECPSAILESFLQGVLRACALVLAQCLDEMPAERMLWVDFEELRTAPGQVLGRVVAFLEPDSSGSPESCTRDLSEALARIPIHDGSRATVPENEASLALERLMAAARLRFGDPLSATRRFHGT